MKRITSLAVIAVLLAPTSASAQSMFTQIPSSHFTLKISEPASQTIQVPKKDEPKPKPVDPPKPVVVIHDVIEGDNLSKIGTQHNVEWQRLWAKNTQLEHPDRINVGDKITIPLPDEKLERELPVAVALPVETPNVTPTRSDAPTRSNAPQIAPSANYGGGNTYDYGYCTWYVKNRRGASLPNNLGNANTWYSRAASQGMAVGSTPRAGAVGTTTRGALGHVVYVESVNGDGSINISEMNAPTFGVTTYRTASASEFMYIY